MGIPFSRSKFAKILGVTPARISQMQTAQQIVEPPIQMDEKAFFWPSSYAEAIAAQRSGRKASSSIYGFLPPVAPATADQVALVGSNGKWSFAQKFVTDSGSVVIATLLNEQTSSKWPGLSPQPAKSTHASQETMLDMFISIAHEMLEGDLFATSWVWIDSNSPSTYRVQEVVIIDDGQPSRDQSGYSHQASPYRAELTDLTFEVLAGKLGRPVPVFPSSMATPEVVEQWLAGGHVSPVEVALDTNWFEHYAAAAALIRDMPETAMSNEQRNLLCGALNSEIRWEESGQLNEKIAEYNFWPESLSTIQLHAVARQPNYARFQELLGGAFTDIDSVSDEMGRELIDHISDLIEYRYGPFGETPDTSVATALSVAQACLAGKFRHRPPYGRFEYKEYKDFRSFKPVQSTYWQAYCSGLKRLERIDTPAARELDAWKVTGEIEDKRRLMIDPQGNPVLLTSIQNRWEKDGAQEIVFAIAAVPVVTHDSRPAAGKDFTQIIIVPDTQRGPALIRTSQGIQLMPLASGHSGPYTHGYGGGGPSNLIGAITGFLSWAAETELTAIGKDRLRSIVVGTDQSDTIVAARGNLLGPGSTRQKDGQ